MAAVLQATFSNSIFLNKIRFNSVTEICSQRSNWHYVSIGSDDGLAPNRQQAIIWTNGGLVYLMHIGVIRPQWVKHISCIVLQICPLTSLLIWVQWDQIYFVIEWFDYLADHAVFIMSRRLSSLRWRHNGRDSVSNHQPHHCLLNRLFRRRSKKTSKPRVTGLLCGEFTGDRWIPRTNGQ